MNTSNTSSMTRRTFVRTTSLASAAGLAFPTLLKSQQKPSANDKLNIAFVGVGGRGSTAVLEHEHENLVAFCDVDDARAAVTYDKFPEVPRFRDYRKMFDRLDRQIDAVRISTPDHMHFPVAMAAIALGKHVYVEKPLTHTVEESRRLLKAAREKKIVTQMGNQGHSNQGIHILKEWVRAGVLGEVRHVHSWTDRPRWPQGLEAPDHSKLMPVVPETMDWDLWLGVAPKRAYDPAFAPTRWRGYWDYGCGALGDMACHIMDGAYWALDLSAPEWIEASSAKITKISAPTASIVTYQFPARGNMPPVTWKWYDGGLKPVLPSFMEPDRALPANGTLLIGSKASVLADTYYASVRIVPEPLMRELASSLPRPAPLEAGITHSENWAQACKTGSEAVSHFDYAAPFSEVTLLGNIALRMGRRLSWDAAAMKFANYDPANQLLKKEYRPGFGV